MTTRTTEPRRTDAAQAPFTGTLRLGVSASAMPYLPRFSERFEARNPLARLRAETLALGAAAGQTGLDTADLASRAGRSQFAAKAPARARPRGQLTAAQRAWLDAERSAGGGRRR